MSVVLPAPPTGWEYVILPRIIGGEVKYVAEYQLIPWYSVWWQHLIGSGLAGVAGLFYLFMNIYRKLKAARKDKDIGLKEWQEMTLKQQEEIDDLRRKSMK